MTMDAFKPGEVTRMELGGNRPWKDFFNAHRSNTVGGRDFDGCTIGERYDSDAGEEWKERLTARVEGVAYVPRSSSRKAGAGAGDKNSVAGGETAASGRNTPLASIRSSSQAPQRTASPSQKARNEAFFASKGEENASRSADLPPSAGGKYAGFGSGPPPQPTPNPNGIPTGDDFQNDPFTALTKSFGWLSSTVSKQAASVNQAYIQPGMKAVAEGDFAAQARAVGAQTGTYIQQSTKNVGDHLNRFVDPDAEQPPPGGPRGVGAAPPEQKDFWDSFGQAPEGPPREKKGFWDDFAAAGEVTNQSKSGSAGKPTSIGTSAMKTGGSGGGVGKKDEGWGDW